MSRADLLTHEELLRDGKELVASGDLKCSYYRTMYNDLTGNTTTLTDDEIIVMVMSADDDKDPEDWVKTMLELEGHKADAAHSGAPVNEPVAEPVPEHA